MGERMSDGFLDLFRRYFSAWNNVVGWFIVFILEK